MKPFLKDRLRPSTLQNGTIANLLPSKTRKMEMVRGNLYKELVQGTVQSLAKFRKKDSLKQTYVQISKSTGKREWFCADKKQNKVDTSETKNGKPPVHSTLLSQR